MGYPFDRPTPTEVLKIDDFIKNYSNMLIRPMTIRHIHPHKVSVHRKVDNVINEETS